MKWNSAPIGKKNFRIVGVGLVIFSSIFFSIACTHLPQGTPYQPLDDSGFGFQIVPVDGKLENLYVSEFKGNQNTKENDARIFTMLAAFQTCIENGMFGIVAPPESDISPAHFKSAFQCLPSLKALEGHYRFRDVPAELVHLITKDFKGGVLVSEAEGPNLKRDDVLVRLGPIRIENNAALFEALQKLPVGAVEVEIIRDQAFRRVPLRIVDNTKALVLQHQEAVRFLCSLLKGDLPEICISRLAELKNGSEVM